MSVVRRLRWVVTVVPLLWLAVASSLGANEKPSRAPDNCPDLPNDCTSVR
jgi:hypothetical protein